MDIEFEAMVELSVLCVKFIDQHIEMGNTRRKCDYQDCKKFLEWLEEQNSFQFEDEHLHSISSRLV